MVVVLLEEELLEAAAATIPTADHSSNAELQRQAVRWLSIAAADEQRTAGYAEATQQQHRERELQLQKESEEETTA